MFGSSVTNGLTLTKVLSGISKTLNVANQVIPLYREAKPMINNAKTILNVLKEFNKKPKSNLANENTDTNKKNTLPEKNYSFNSPSFFH